jgi:hypothetical protein
MVMRDDWSRWRSGQSRSDDPALLRAGIIALAQQIANARQSRPGCWGPLIQGDRATGEPNPHAGGFAQAYLFQQLLLRGRCRRAKGITARPSVKLSKFNVNLRIPGPNPVLIHRAVKRKRADPNLVRKGSEHSCNRRCYREVIRHTRWRCAA